MRVLLDYGEREQYPDFPKEIPDVWFNEEWALHNHDQTLKRLNERGGLDPREMIGNIERIKWSVCMRMPLEEAINKLLKKLKEDNQ